MSVILPSRHLVISILFHTVYLFSIFDIYFVTPVVTVNNRFTVTDPKTSNPWAPAKRTVLIVGDGLRADKLFQPYQNPPFPISIPLPSTIQTNSTNPSQSPSVDHSPSPFFPAHLNLTTPAPFLLSLIANKTAKWGISHTRVPTESRPGHVALIAGMYEDVSAVTRGWSTNPVQFDSVFNQSRKTWAWGSPDIVPMFSPSPSSGEGKGKGREEEEGKLVQFCYESEDEDFSKDATALDLWVLDSVVNLFLNSTRTSPQLRDDLNPIPPPPREDQDSDSKVQGGGGGVGGGVGGNIFFLHLLGLDTTGHSYRPHGPEYHRNIRVVDHVLARVDRLFREYFGDDDDTLFVFTADHGMSSVGNHGDGSLDNTRTPLVVWGKGVSEEGSEEREGNDEYSLPWNLPGRRRDVEQADVAVLIATLAGIPIPANSAGRFPHEYVSSTMDRSAEFKARAAVVNARQVLEQVGVKSRNKERHSLPGTFRPFEPLLGSEQELDDIERLIDGGADGGKGLREALDRSLRLVDLGLEGARYFHTYDWFTLRTIVTLGYVGYILYSISFILGRSSTPTTATTISRTSSLLHPLPLAIIVLTILLAVRFLLERAPWSYYLYLFFPSYFFLSLTTTTTTTTSSTSSSSSCPTTTSSQSHQIQPSTLLLPLTTEIMLYGYFHREVFSLLLVGMGIGWPLLGMKTRFVRECKALIVGWVASTTLLAVFPLLRADRVEDLRVNMAGGFAVVVLSLFCLSRLPESMTLPRVKRFVLLVVGLTIMSMGITWSSSRMLSQKLGLPLHNQIGGWLVLVLSTVVPLLHGRPTQPSTERLLVLLTSFGPAFVILSLSYEGLFFVTFCVTLGVWATLEVRLERWEKKEGSGDEKESRGARVKKEHLRLATFFLAFLHVAFFGCGNVASISSFYLEPVYRLIPIFLPFPMAALLLFKLLTPFVALASITSILNHSLHLPPFSLFLIATTLSDLMALHFFYLVSDSGSWLEIGSSISNFAICSLLNVFNTGLYLAGEAVLRGSVV
ncbi:PigN-domain-containing protein [Meredithblackwellia eburnea MCA 4105]